MINNLIKKRNVKYYVTTSVRAKIHRTVHRVCLYVYRQWLY